MPSMDDLQSLQAIGVDCFLATSEKVPPLMQVHFLGADNEGHAQHLFSGLRLLRRVG